MFCSLPLLLMIFTNVTILYVLFMSDATNMWCFNWHCKIYPWEWFTRGKTPKKLDFKFHKNTHNITFPFMISRVLPVFKITGVCVTPCTLLGMIIYDRFLIELSLSQNNPQYEIIIFLSKIRYVCVSEIKFLVYFHTYIYFLSKTNRYKVGAFFIHMVNFIFVWHTWKKCQ